MATISPVWLLVCFLWSVLKLCCGSDEWSDPSKLRGCHLEEKTVAASSGFAHCWRIDTDRSLSAQYDHQAAVLYIRFLTADNDTDHYTAVLYEVRPRHFFLSQGS